MSYPNPQNREVQVSFANNASLTDAGAIGNGMTVVGIIMPAAWTAANLTFQAAGNDGTFNNLYNDATELTYTGAASRYISVDPARFDCVQQLKVRSGTSGAPVNQLIAATGYLQFSGQPIADETVTINGVTITWKNSGATGNEVNIGATAADTVAALVTFLNASGDGSINIATYSVNAGDSLRMDIVHDTPGTAGSTFTLAEASTNVAVSGATLVNTPRPLTLVVRDRA